MQICTGLFRTATNRDAFENMLAILSRTLRMESPATTPPPPQSVVAHTVATGISIPGRSAPAAAPAPVSPAPEPEPEVEEPKQEVQLPKITIRREIPKVGRNDACPCGSGKKFKNCCGQ